MDKLAEITTDGNFRAKVEACLNGLKDHGENPKIFEALRTRAQQREKVRLGYSKTMNSYHLKRGSDDLALAADIADMAKAWNASRRFWMILGANAMAHSVGWGGLFGLNAKQKGAVVRSFVTLRSAGWPREHEAYRVHIGWDPAHVQIERNWP